MDWRKKFFETQQALVKNLETLQELSYIQHWSNGNFNKANKLLQEIDQQMMDYQKGYADLIQSHETEMGQRRLAFQFNRMRELGMTAQQIARQEQLPVAVVESLLN